MTTPRTARPAWLDRYTAAIDTMDVEQQLPFFTDDATFTFGNNPPMTGHDGIRAGIGAFFGGIHGIRHTVTHCWQPDDETVIVEFETTYIRLDDTKVTLNAGAVFRLRDDKIADYRVYADVTPVFAA